MPFYRYGDASCFTRSIRTFSCNYLFLQNNDYSSKNSFKNALIFTRSTLQCNVESQIKLLIKINGRSGTSASNSVAAILVTEINGPEHILLRTVLLPETSEVSSKIHETSKLGTFMNNIS